jgi:hypothetical protein
MSSMLSSVARDTERSGSFDEETIASVDSEYQEGVPPQSKQTDDAVLLLLTSLAPWLATVDASRQFCEGGGVGMLLQVRE